MIVLNQQQRDWWKNLSVQQYDELLKLAEEKYGFTLADPNNSILTTTEIYQLWNIWQTG